MVALPEFRAVASMELEGVAEMKIYSPTLAKRRETVPIASRGKALEGQTWGFVDTSKVNADIFIEDLKADLLQNYHPMGFTIVRKETPGVPLSSAQIEQLQECGFVVFCFGD